MPARSELGFERRARLAAARLYLVCDANPGGRPLADVLRAAIAGGVDVVQLREKQLDDAALTALAREAGALCRQLGVLFLVNDRPAVALAAGADGVHVGQHDLSVARVRELVGTELLLGLSTHTPAEVDLAAAGTAGGAGGTASGGAAGVMASDAAGARASVAAGIPAGVDYIGVGPVHATPTKPGRPAVGLELVRYAAARAAVPFFAIGGIDAGNIVAALAAGARRVAVVRAIAAAADPELAAQTLRTALDTCTLEGELAAR